ncbi:MAG: head-tail connector protein [Oscillospiraceae bacterium]|jgi:uncharacterized phage protein (predicted DNA packaging)|nr:head-tail connector protein [Oscillospiraceae bacterium]
MMMSQISLADVKLRLRIDYNTDDTELTAIMAAAKQTLLDWTGLTAAEADEKPQMYHAFMALCQHMYDNNELTAQRTALDAAVQTIIAQCSTAEVLLA